MAVSGDVGPDLAGNSGGERARPAPGPSGMLGLGALRAIERDPLAYFTDLRERYGDVCSLNLLGQRAFLVSHPDGVAHVLHANHTRYDKDTIDYRMLKSVLGEGLVTSEGELWKRQRRLIQPAFHKARLASFGAIMVRETADLVERLAGRHAGEVVDLAQCMHALTLDIVTKSLFGVDMGERGRDVGRTFTLLNEHLTRRYTSPLATLPIVPSRANRAARRAGRELDELVVGIVRERRQSGEDSGDLLSMLLLAQDEATGAGMSDRQLRDEVVTLMIAGHETTANALAWTFYLLARHADEEAAAVEEIDRVLGGRAPTYEDLGALDGVRRVVEESMRLFPPAWAISRAPLVDDAIGGFAVPRRALVFLSPYLTHRHPAVWDEPERFDPGRFSAERSRDRPKFAYFPFGGGPRLCIGMGFAMSEAQLILATLLQRFRFELASDEAIEPEPLITLRPRGGVPVRVRPR